MNDKTTNSSDVLVVEPVEPDTSEEEARSSVFAAFMAAARALKPGDDAGIQDLMYKAVWPKRSEPKLTELKLTDLQAEMLIQAIHTSTGFKLGVLRKTWAKFLKEARAEEEAATSAGPGGAGGARAGPSGSYGPSGGFNQSFAGAFGQFCLDETGLYWRQKKKWSRIAGPFEILGYARDVKSEEWGEVIKFANKDKLVRKEIVTAALLYDDPNAVISRLGSLGMWISGVLSERRALIEYLLLEFETDKRATVVRRIGWFEIGAERVFVLPDEIIGVALSEQIILEQDVGAPYARRGTVEEWRNAIAKPAGDHLMARFVISTGLSGTLLYLGGFESGITHLKGDSSIGKTTLLRMAASTWGSGADNGFVRKWRSTDNALEATLSSSNDTLLPLDEIGQVDVRVIGQIVYMVASNVGKQRMRRDATVRSSHQWRTLVLSSGEKPIAILLAEGHSKRAHAGQLVRAIDVPAKRTKNSAFDRPNPTFELEGVRRRHEARRLDLLRDGWARICPPAGQREDRRRRRAFPGRRFYREGARERQGRFRTGASGGAAFRDRRDGGRARDRAWPIAVAQRSADRGRPHSLQGVVKRARRGGTSRDQADDRASSPFHGGAQRKPVRPSRAFRSRP